MSWRDRFTAVGSFRGVPFVVRNADEQFGRRVQIHELPGRDDPVPEDLGLAKKEHSIEVFVAGDDYQDQRDRLKAALNKAGPGTLVHPWFGTLNITITTARQRESTRDGGMATFNISFVVTPPTPRLDLVDTQAALRLAAGRTLVESINDFATNFDVLGLADDFVDGIIDDVEATMLAAENVVTGVTGDVTSLIASPFNMGVAIIGSFNRMKSALKATSSIVNLYDDKNTSLSSSSATSLNSSQSNLANQPQTKQDLAQSSLTAYRKLFTAGDDLTPVPTTTPNRQRQSDNIAAVHRAVQQGAVASAALVSADITHASLDDAVALRDTLVEAIESQIYQPMGDALYQAFADLRAALVTDLRERGMKLPRLQSFTPQQAMPSVLIAQRLYGDATREAEIADRNHILHPGFIPAGEALEVIADV